MLRSRLNCQQAAGLRAGRCPSRARWPCRAGGAGDPLVSSGAVTVQRAVPGARGSADTTPCCGQGARSCPKEALCAVRGSSGEVQALARAACMHKPGWVRAKSSLVMASATVARPIICQSKQMNQVWCALKRTFRRQAAYPHHAHQVAPCGLPRRCKRCRSAPARGFKRAARQPGWCQPGWSECCVLPTLAGREVIRMPVAPGGWPMLMPLP